MYILDDPGHDGENCGSITNYYDYADEYCNQLSPYICEHNSKHKLLCEGMWS